MPAEKRERKKEVECVLLPGAIRNLQSLIIILFVFISATAIRSCTTEEDTDE